MNIPRGRKLDPGRGFVLLQKIDDVEASRVRMDKVLREAVAGRKFNPAELLALQAGMYRLNTELELAAKVVENSNAAVKRALSTEV